MVFVRLIKISAEVFMAELLTLIYKPEVFVLMALQYKGHLTFDNKKHICSFESLFIDNVLSRMMLCFEKWRYPCNEVLMLLII